MDIYGKILSILNGPIILLISIFGIILNSLAIYILAMIVFPVKTVNNNDSPNSLKSKQTSLKTKLVDREVQDEPAKSLLETRVSIKKKRRPKIFIYFLWLTGCDIFLLVCSIFNFSIPTVLYDLPKLYMKAIPFWYTFSNASFTASVWLMIALIIDRYCSLCRRFKNIVIAQRIKSRRVHIILAMISIFSLVYSLPRFFELKIDYNEKYDLYFIRTSGLFDSWGYMIIYRVIGSLICYSVLPYVFIFIIFSKFWIVLKASLVTQHSLHVNQVKNSKKNPIESDRLLIALAMKFLISRLPTTLIDIYEMLKGSHEFFNSSIAMYFVYVSNFLVIFSSATTFFMFVSFSYRFQNYVFSICKISKCK